MSRVVSLLILVISICFQISHGQASFSAPEGVVFDYDSNRYFVTNWNSGAIVQIDSTGQKSYFKTGLISCSGIHIYNGVLYVSVNNHTLYGFDLTTAATVLTLPLSNSGLHGITSDTSGYLYVADGSTDKIYRVDPVAGTHTDYITSGLTNPLGLEFDIRNNRVIVTNMASSNNIKAVDLSTGLLSDVTTLTFANLDDVTSDQDGNFYISAFNDDFGKIYMYDNNFANPPVEIDSIGSHGLLDIFYNQRDDLLAATIYWKNEVRFIQMRYQIGYDKTYGWAPLDINFSGSSELAVDSWEWDFDDGGTSSEQNPTYTYTEPGWYSGSMTIHTTDDNNYTRTFPTPIAVLADTLKADTSYGYGGESVAFEIKIRNFAPLSRIYIPLEYRGNLLLTYDSTSVAGCRTEGYTYSMAFFDPFNKYIIFDIRVPSDGSKPLLPPGEGTVLKVYFTYFATAKPGTTTEMKLDGFSTTYDDYLPLMVSDGFDYEPLYKNGYMSVPIPPCCVNDRGNFDYDSEDVVDIADLVFMVDYQFRNGDAPECFDESNLVIDGVIDVADLVFMVDYQFRDGAPPPSCL